MKNLKLKLCTLPLIMFVAMACSQKSETAVTKNSGETLSPAKDSVAIAAEKKKAAEAEKARLPKPYHPEDRAEEKIAQLIQQAKAENKNIMIQAGGNWCIWCLRFNDYVQKTPELKAVVDQNYLYYHLNYSPENKNEKVFSKYGNPGEKFGYPVFIVLDSHGKHIHTQDSAVLEEGKGYSLEKTRAFFEKWVPKS